MMRNNKKVSLFLLFYLFTFLPFSPLSTSAQTYPKVGLVLSGGGAKGAATVGVLKVLEEKGIHVDCIAGTSIGSIVGALYAADYNARQLETMFREQDWIPLLTDHRDDLWTTPYKKIGSTHYVFGFPIYDENSQGGTGVLRASQVEEYIRSMLKEKGCEKFDDLKVPFYCVATDMDSVQEVVFHEGSVTRAVRASMAIPAIFKSVEIDGRRLVDGGAVNNLPIDVLIEHEHPDIIIVVDLTQKAPSKNELDNTVVQTIGTYLQFLAQLIGLGNITQWLLTQPQVDSYHHNMALLRTGVDVYINPRLGDYSYASFSREMIDDMISMGEASARTEALNAQFLKIATLQLHNHNIKERLQNLPFGGLLHLK